MTELEFKLLGVKKRSVAFEEAKNSSDANEGKDDDTFGFQAIRSNIRKKRGDLKDKIQFKRKRAKVRIRHLASLLLVNAPNTFGCFSASLVFLVFDSLLYVTSYLLSLVHCRVQIHYPARRKSRVLIQIMQLQKRLVFLGLYSVLVIYRQLLQHCEVRFRVNGD